MALRRAASVLTTRALRAATAAPAALAMAQPLCPARFASSGEHIKAPATPNPTLDENAPPIPPPLEEIERPAEDRPLDENSGRIKAAPNENSPPPPSQPVDEIERLIEAHRQAECSDTNDQTAAAADVDALRDVITARNALPVAMLQCTVSTELLTAARENQATVLRAVEQLCTLSHSKASLEALIEVLLVLNPAMDATDEADSATWRASPDSSPIEWQFNSQSKRRDRLRRRFLLGWCRLRLFDPALPDTREEESVRHELLCLLNEGSAPFLLTAVGRDEFFLRLLRRDTDRRAALSHLRFSRCIAHHANLDVFATAEFFDEFFLKFARLQGTCIRPLCIVIARSSADRCRPLLTTAFRDTCFLRTLDDLRCRVFKGYDATSGRSAFSAIVCCREFTCAAAEKGIRFPCTIPLRDFITSLINEALLTREYSRGERVAETLREFAKILRESTDFAVLRTAGFRDSFFLKVADGLAAARYCPRDGYAAFAQILAHVIHSAPPAEIEVFATEDIRDFLIVPLSLHVPGRLNKRDRSYQQEAEFKTAFTAAFNTIARTEDGSLKAVFDTEVVRLKVLPRLAVRSWK